ncbi:MAG TPA: ArsR family transcriptional regulator [Syntrophomonadaceae bacterium]|nr:ArsR family transcriptional regulator [Syntrophomonadaceae bacterium]
MLDSLITSKTRLKLLLKFFLNPETSSHLRALAAEFGESTNAVRVELNRLTNAGLLETNQNGRSIDYKVNKKHTLFPEINSIVKKYLGIDEIIESIVKQLGNVQLALITGDYAQGIDSGLIDLVLVGEIDKVFLDQLVDKSEAIIKRKIRTLVLSPDDFDLLKDKLEKDNALPVWNQTLK